MHQPYRLPPDVNAVVEQPRVALVAGTLMKGGAEKQLVYMARALASAGVQLRIYTLMRGGDYEAILSDLGFDPIWIGQRSHPLWRLKALIREVGRFRPHVVQATHAYANLYAALAARACGALPLGAIRSDGRHDVESNGRWGPWLLRAPAALLTNSHTARRNLEDFGVAPERIHVVENVIDLDEFDAAAAIPDISLKRPLLLSVGHLEPEKRVDRFLTVLALARRTMPGLAGAIIGDGPEASRLREQAASLGLLPEAVQFLGKQTNVPALIAQADVLVLTSDREGLPNALLEAMAARVPFVTTPAGDAALLAGDAQGGYVVGFEDVEKMAAQLVEIVSSQELRARLGGAGRRWVEDHYSPELLGWRLLECYRRVASAAGASRLLQVLDRLPSTAPWAAPRRR